MRLLRRFCGGSGVSRPGLAVVLAVSVCALSLLVSALVSVDRGAQGQQDDSAPLPFLSNQEEESSWANTTTTSTILGRH